MCFTFAQHCTLGMKVIQKYRYVRVLNYNCKSIVNVDCADLRGLFSHAPCLIGNKDTYVMYVIYLRYK